MLCTAVCNVLNAKCLRLQRSEREFKTIAEGVKYRWNMLKL